jgi:hypothetical protein
MNIRQLSIALLATLTGVSALVALQTEAQHAEKLRDIRRLMELTGDDRMANQLLDQMAANLRASGEMSSERFLQEYRKAFDSSKVIEIQVAAIDKYLSAEDVRAIVRFYESPAGQRMREAMPKVFSETLAQSKALSEEVSRKVLRKLAEEPPPERK